MMISITSTFFSHILWHSIWRSTYLLIFSVAFFWILQSLGIATSIIRHLSESFSYIMMSDLLHGMCLSVLTWWSHRMVAFSFSITCSGLYWYQCCASTLILHISRCSWAATWLCLLRYLSVASFLHSDMICSIVSALVWHILHLSVDPCLIICLL